MKKLALVTLALILAVMMLGGCIQKPPAHNIELYYTVQIKDSSGHIESSISGRSKSYVTAFMDMLYVQAFGAATTITVTDQSGTGRAVASYSGNFSVAGGAGANYYGIIVGTGNTAVAITDYQLAARIAHGTGAGQLSYSANVISAIATSGSSRQFTVTRTFTNGTANTITVKEIGLGSLATSNSWVVLIARDVISDQAIAASKVLTVIYTIKVTA